MFVEGFFTARNTHFSVTYLLGCWFQLDRINFLRVGERTDAKMIKAVNSLITTKNAALLIAFTSMNPKLPTRGQLERELSQKILKLYRQELQHLPQKITCTLFDNRLVIIVEGAITAVEKTLINEDNSNKIAKNANLAIGEAIKHKLKDLVAEILAVEVEDILFDSTLETERTGAIVTLSQAPLVRNPKSASKIKRHKDQDQANLE